MSKKHRQKHQKDRENIRHSPKYQQFATKNRRLVVSCCSSTRFKIFLPHEQMLAINKRRVS
jgi:hypothetical protein